MEYRLEQYNGSDELSLEWLSLWISADYTPAGISMLVAQYKLSDIKAIIDSNSNQWRHPLNYNDSSDFLTAIARQRMRTSSIYIQDSREIKVIFDARLANSESYGDIGNDNGRWFLDGERALSDIDPDSLEQFRPWIDLFIGQAWEDRTGLPHQNWNTQKPGESLVRFKTHLYLSSPEVRSPFSADIDFRKYLYNDIVKGNISTYQVVEGDVRRLALEEIKESLSYDSYEGQEEEEVKIHYKPDELYLLEIEGFTDITGDKMVFRPDHFWYGIKTVMGIFDRKMVIAYEDMLSYLMNHQQKVMKKAGKLLKKDRYDYHLGYMEDVYGRLVYDFESDSDDFDVPTYYVDIVRKIPKER